MFRDCLAEAEAVVPKASLDRWVHDYTQSGTVFSPEKANGTDRISTYAHVAEHNRTQTWLSLSTPTVS